MLLRNIPADINVELLLSYFSPGSFKVLMKGLHKRNAYHDIMNIEEKPDGTMDVEIGRNSIYNALPEFLFHPIDRFRDFPRLEEKERFAEELEKQEKEKENAYRFFAPIDVQLLLYRMQIRETMRPFTETNSILYDMLGDRLTAEQRANRFIKKTIPFLTSCKIIRGNKTLLTWLLRKVFMDEGLAIDEHERECEYSDANPRYMDGLDGALNESYVGNVYDEVTSIFDIHYWPEEVDDSFLQLVDEIETFRLFVQDYFMSIEERLHFNLTHDDPASRLSDNEVYNYLNYNTNI